MFVINVEVMLIAAMDMKKLLTALEMEKKLGGGFVISANTTHHQQKSQEKIQQTTLSKHQNNQQMMKQRRRGNSMKCDVCEQAIPQHSYYLGGNTAIACSMECAAEYEDKIQGFPDDFTLEKSKEQ